MEIAICGLSTLPLFKTFYFKITVGTQGITNKYTQSLVNPSPKLLQGWHRIHSRYQKQGTAPFVERTKWDDGNNSLYSFQRLIIPYSGLSGGSVIKNPSASAGVVSWIPGSGRSLGEGNGNPLQYTCLGNPMDRGAWWVTVHGVTKESDRT